MAPRHPKVTGPCTAVFDVLPPAECESVGAVLSRVGDKWSILVIYLLSGGPMRFSELKRRIGSISQKVLTSTLRGLERDGYLVRHVTPASPPQVSYELTSLGRDVLAPVTALAMWAFGRRHEVEASRKAFDRRAARIAGSAADA